jgi:hypothetical protein
MKYALLMMLGMLVMAGCASAPKYDVAAVLGKEFTLGQGQAAYIASESMLVKFVNVTEDSRCPSDVVCVWAGQVTTQLQVAGSGFNLGGNVTLGSGSKANLEFTDSKNVTYLLEVLEVSPYPKSTDTARNYSAKMKITKK